jgi:hypothetical protein
MGDGILNSGEVNPRSQLCVTEAKRESKGIRGQKARVRKPYRGLCNGHRIKACLAKVTTTTTTTDEASGEFSRLLGVDGSFI